MLPKKPPAFFDSLKECRYFVPPCGTKLVASRREASTLGVLHARLARQGFARYLISFEAGFAPSNSPRVDELLIVWGMFIDKLKSRPPYRRSGLLLILMKLRISLRF